MPKNKDYKVFKIGRATVIVIPKHVQELADIRAGDILNWQVHQPGMATVKRERTLTDEGKIKRH